MPKIMGQPITECKIANLPGINLIKNENCLESLRVENSNRKISKNCIVIIYFAAGEGTLNGRGKIRISNANIAAG